jgi:O-antigen/teichoic acid export membrane protein
VHPVASGALARAFSFLPTAVASLLVSRLIVAHYGIPAFDGFTLAESLIVLVPLGDLGVGSAITAAFASGDPAGPEAEGVVLTATRIMAVSALLVTVVAVLMTAVGAWPTVIGTASYGGSFFGLGMIFYAAGFVPGLGQAMLLGVHRNHLTVLVQTLMMPFVLVAVALLILTDGDGRWIVALPAAALTATNFLLGGLATRITRLSWRSVVRKIPQRARYPGSRIRGIAGPRLVLSLAIPLAVASDRIVLSHVSTAQEVAKYGVCLQIFAPVVALLGAAAQPLWPIYVAAKATGSAGPRVWRAVLLFGGVGVAMCGALLPFSRPLGNIVGDGKVDLGLLLPFATALMTVGFAVAYPVAMVLTRPNELRFIAVTYTAAVPLNVAASIVLGRELGAPGPALASAGLGFGVLLVGAYYVRSHVLSPTLT